MEINESIFFPIWEEGEKYDYPMAFDFRPGVHAYIHEEDEAARAVVMVPGGAYKLVSPTESWSVGRKYYEAGYNVFIVRYTTNLFKTDPLYDLPPRELAKAISIIRREHVRYKTDPGKITVLGFSAGAHLAASLLVHHNDVGSDARPDAGILAYPVITAMEGAHKESFQALLGMDIYERKDEEAARLLRYYSLENWVDEDTPPVFLWHTVTDELVPCANSIIFEEKLRQKGIMHALHLYSQGPHGLSSADEEWADRVSEDTWCIEQVKEAYEGVAKTKPGVSKAMILDAKVCYEDHVTKERGDRMPYKEVSAWIRDSMAFLDNVFDRK